MSLAGRLVRSVPAVALVALATVLAHPVHAAEEAPAQETVAEETASWRLEQPSPPPPPPGVPAPVVAVPLGKVGDIEFWEPPGEAPQANRGLLITHGNGAAVPPGVWAYDGSGWHEIATVCGATDGRIAWGGPADFWTVSDQRSGQAPLNGQPPPLEDDSLCHFSGGSIVASYAHLAFEASSYEKISGAACLPPLPPQTQSGDCWFGGEQLPEPRVGSFHLHWNGSTLTEQPYIYGSDPVKDMRQLEDAIYESVSYSMYNAHDEERTLARPPVLHLAEAETEMQPLTAELPLYGTAGQPAEAFEYLRLGSSEGVLWAAAGKRLGVPNLTKEEEGQVTVLRRLAGIWRQVIGPGGEGRQAHPLPRLFESEQQEREWLGGLAKNAEVRAIAPEPGGEDAWLALAPHVAQTSAVAEAAATAVLVHISAQGAVLGVQTLPSSAERALPSDAAGAAKRLVCPAVEDCWMANVNGWLYHLAREKERTLPRSELPGFPEGKIVGERPPDEGIPQEVLDAPPPDTSGLPEEAFEYGTFAEVKAATETRVRAPLITHVHTRLIHGTTLQLRFHLTVKARVGLLAKRHKKVVARTRMRTFRAGKRRLLLRLNRHRWPTELSLKTHALAPLPTTILKEPAGGPEHPSSGVNTESTRLTVLPLVTSFAGAPSFAGSGTLP
jgi:hypothetical protein